MTSASRGLVAAGAVVAVLLGVAGCGSADDGEREVVGTESPEPAFTPAPYVGRFEDPCDALPVGARHVSNAVAEADRAELAHALDHGKGVEAVGLSICGDVNVVLIGLSEPTTQFPSEGTRGTPILTQAQGPFRAS